VREDVRDDAIRQAAYELALADAEAAAEAGLPNAKTVGPALPRDLMTRDEPALGGPLPLGAQSPFVDGLYAMIPPEENITIRADVIELPRAGRVIAARVTDVRPTYLDAAGRERLLAGTRNALDRRDLDVALLSEYLNPDAVAARTGFKGPPELD
jgi:hypothetical protein